MSKRLKFFTGHLTVSILVALSALCVVFLLWYPVPLAKAAGVTSIFLMLMAIDMVIGPLFGWMVYKEGKKNLKIDLAVVIILQISAFCYGFYSIAQARPAWIVYTGLTFDAVRYNDIERKNIEQAEAQFQRASLFGPTFVAIKNDFNLTPQQRSLWTQSAKREITSFSRYPAFYQDIQGAKSRMQSSAFPLFTLNQFNEPAQVETVIKKYPQANAWFGLTGFMQDMTVLINKDTGEVVKIVDLRPWK